VATGPPKVLGTPKPRSSTRTITTFGAPAGAFTSKRGGIAALRASSSVMGGFAGARTGSTVRSSAGWAPAAATNAADSSRTMGSAFMIEDLLGRQMRRHGT
jgi:hypothetical protein